MSVPQQTAVLQAATVRCPPNVFRERYSLEEFEVTHTYGEGPNWSICAARCKWSNAPVVLQIYAEVGNLSGCMALALAAAHGLTHHSLLLPLYAVFRDVAALSGGQADGKGNVNGAGNDNVGGSMACGDKVVMVYPGGPAQHPLDTGTLGSSASNSLPPGSSLGGSGPPVSERGVVRGVLQPLAELVSLLGPMGLRPPYVCGLDVWMDSPEAPGPGQALFMVPLMCHRWSNSVPPEILPAALRYVAPYLRDHPAAAGDQGGRKEDGVKRWLSWSAAALVYTVLIGSPPPDKAAARKARGKMPSDPPAGVAAGVPQLPPLAGSNGGLARGAMMLPVGTQRQSASGTPSTLFRTSGSGNGSNGGGGGGGVGVAKVEASNTGNHRNNCVSVMSPRRNARAVDPMPLWLSDEAGDWFRRGLSIDCMSRAPLDEQLKHPWVFRHAVPRSVTFNGVPRRESLSYVPRELHPLMLDVVPMGLARPAREEVDHLMAEMAMTEAPSVARPAMPWQVVEGPKGPSPELVVVDEFTQDTPDAEAERDLSVVERYEVAEEQKEDGTRIIEELRVVSGKADGALSRAAKALQAAMARRAETGQWVMVNPRGSTFDDIARQRELNEQQRVQMGVVTPQPPVVAKRRESNGAVIPQAQAAPKRNPEPTSQAAPTTTATSATAFSRSAPVPGSAGRNKSPGPKGAKGPSKNGKAAK
ncbi:hypothetical protein Vretimale_1948 [Volvox reticuliferus]|uniref:Uncharacterized protein n=1 Tax=Volvox reticuliferus TaxID=1737510 RepID=A0A8J4FJ50_9CHLO|nr:hypothetical protein Vretifemale_4270 [Volvox reticuliferus]GIL96124.1 hypothetical protein Vretimale_1948 [Volvox reticuliferus]